MSDLTPHLGEWSVPNIPSVSLPVHPVTVCALAEIPHELQIDSLFDLSLFLLALSHIQLHDHLVLHKLLPSLVFHDGVLFWFSCLTYLFLSSYGSYTNPLNSRVLQELILQSARSCLFL